MSIGDASIFWSWWEYALVIATTILSAGSAIGFCILISNRVDPHFIESCNQKRKDAITRLRERNLEMERERSHIRQLLAKDSDEEGGSPAGS